MDLRKLKYFVEVVKEQSFSHAAQKLYVSQPMLSKAIQQLEEELGIQLIRRSSKHFQITEEGRLVYQQSKKILNDFYELEHIMDDSSTLLQGTVSISIPLATACAFFIPLFIDIQNKYPEIYIELYESGAHTVVESLLRDIVDIGVVMLPIPTHGIDVYQIIDDQCALVVSALHPLANRECVSIAELEHEKFLLYNQNYVLREVIYQACYSKQFSPKVIFQGAHSEIIFKMVEYNQGITIMPAPACPENNPKLRKIDIEPKIPWKQALAIRKNKYLSPATLQVIEEILSYFKSGAFNEIKHNL